MMSEQDWFGNGDNFYQHLAHLKGVPDLNFLEIGSFNGGSAKWLMNNILTDESSTLTCVDPWEGETYFNNETIIFAKIESQFDKNIEDNKDRVFKNKSLSHEWLMGNRDKKFDFIYIDGDHNPQAVMLDALLSWKLLKPNGLMVFDDYGWLPGDDAARMAFLYGTHAAPAIDLFIEMYKNRIVILEKNVRLWIRKIPNHTNPNSFYV